jgi:hypothetical protein
MATFSNYVFNVFTQNPQRSGVSLSASDNSVILEAGSPWGTTVNVPVSVFNILSGTEVNALTSSPLFANQPVYWGSLSSIGYTLSAKAYTNDQYTLLSGLYVNKPYLATRYASLTTFFTQATATRLAGFYLQNGAPQVQSIMFPSVTGTSSPAASAYQYVGDGVKFRVHPNYHGQTFAVQFTDKSSCLFTVNTGLSTAPLTLSAASFAHRGPNEARLWNLNG